VSQVTSFPYEVIVRDDASTDGTQEILLLLEQEFPKEVRLILERSNSFDEESPLIPLFAAAKGEYFALREGDDYWTSNHKLQLCVGVLEANLSVVLVGHLSTIGPLDTQREHSHETTRVIGDSGLFSKGTLTHCNASSFVGRTSVLRDSSSEYGHVAHGDVKLKVVAAEAGDSVVLGGMSHYTSHAGESRQSLAASVQAP